MSSLDIVASPSLRREESLAYIDLAGSRMLHDLLKAEGLSEKTDSAQWLKSLDSVLGEDKAR